MDAQPQQLKFNLIERVIGVISPNWALSRHLAKMQIENIRRFDAASYSSRLKNWRTPATGPDSISRGAGQIIRNRTRDLDRNNSWFRRAMDILTNNVIGNGIKLQLLTEEISNTRRDLLIKRFTKWFESNDIDYDGIHDGYSLQRLTYRTRGTSGECLLRRHISRENGLQIQILEPDFIDDTKDGITLENGGHISQGIEYNARGKRVAYWLFEEHPNDYMFGKKYQSKRVPAHNIIHYFKPDRPGQGRGIPLGTQIVIRIHDLDLFQDAELKKNQIASLLVGFIRKNGATPSSPSTKKTASEFNLFPGTINELSPGEEMQFSQPPQSQMFPEYVRTVLMEIAAAFGLTYEMLSGDLKRTNFSSGRMGWLESARYFKSDQKDFINLVLNPIFKWWLDYENLKNGTNTQGVTTRWFPPHREMIDPAKEVKAWAQAAEENITPLSHIWAAQGLDEDETITIIAETQRKMRAAGIATSDKKNTSDENEDDEENPIKKDEDE